MYYADYDNEPQLCFSSLELRDFINIGHGRIQVDRSSPILGIYGPNGSGKSTVVKAFKVLRDLFADGICRNVYGYTEYEGIIRQGKGKASLMFSFDVLKKNGTVRGQLEYKVSVRNGSKDLLISEERLSYIDAEGRSTELYKIGARTNKEDIQRISRETEELRAETVNTDIQEKLKEIYKATQKEGCSFLSEKGILYGYVTSSPVDPESFGLERLSTWSYTMAEALNEFACSDLFIFDSYDESIIRKGEFHSNSKGKHVYSITSEGKIAQSFNADSAEELYRDISKNIIEPANSMIKSIIPGEALTLKHDEDNGFIIYSCRNGLEVPVGRESFGVRKIINLVQLLDKVLISKCALLVVDELDAGLYEYYLGNLLTFIRDCSNPRKGTLLFTAHNLYALELVSKSSIFFTTENPERRFVTMKAVKASNNLRDMYIRTIGFGGQKEQLAPEFEESYIVLSMARASMEEGK